MVQLQAHDLRAELQIIVGSVFGDMLVKLTDIIQNKVCEMSDMVEEAKREFSDQVQCRPIAAVSPESCAAGPRYCKSPYLVSWKKKSTATGVTRCWTHWLQIGAST